MHSQNCFIDAKKERIINIEEKRRITRREFQMLFTI